MICVSIFSHSCFVFLCKLSAFCSILIREFKFDIIYHCVFFLFITPSYEFVCTCVIVNYKVMSEHLVHWAFLSPFTHPELLATGHIF